MWNEFGQPLCKICKTPIPEHSKCWLCQACYKENTHPFRTKAQIRYATFKFRNWCKEGLREKQQTGLDQFNSVE